jgi:hypothetical protein
MAIGDQPSQTRDITDGVFDLRLQIFIALESLEGTLQTLRELRDEFGKPAFVAELGMSNAQMAQEFYNDARNLIQTYSSKVGTPSF